MNVQFLLKQIQSLFITDLFAIFQSRAISNNAVPISQVSL